jgi:tetratricopeptide (TPR) repeat protein
MRLQVVAVSLYAFLMALLWPYASRADNPPPAQPPPTGGAVNDEALAQAKQHFEAGKNAYNAGDYVTAIREFKAAEALRPSPILAYNIGLANEKLGKKRVALKYYKRYLEEMPNAPNRAEVDGRIAQLEQDVASQPPPPPPQPDQPPPPTAEQPGDMPPPPQAAQPAGTYDPYGSTAQPVPVGQTAPKKKSYWWVWLIVAGGGLILIGIIVAVALTVGSTSYYYADHALMTNPRDPATSAGRTNSLYPLFHF